MTTAAAPPTPTVPTWLAASLGLGLAVGFALLYPVRGFHAPVGPDAPVYIWWTNLAGFDGLSAVTRPGVPGLVLTLGSVTGLSPHLIYAALGATLAGTIGAAAAALTARSTLAGTWPRSCFLIVGILAGAFSAHLAGGYMANLVWAACLLGAGICLSTGTRRSTFVAAGLVAAAGFAHPIFWPIAAWILLLSFPLRRSGGRFLDTPGGQIIAAVGAGGLLFGLGMASTLLGPRPLTVPTSKDAYLRRAGYGELLGLAFRARFTAHVPRYLLPLSLPLAWFGGRSQEPASFLRRFLRGWGILVAVGVLGGLITTAWPPERLLTSAYALPIAAGLGILVLYRRVASRRWLAVTLAGACFVTLLGASVFTWSQQHPFFDVAGGQGSAFAAAAASAAAAAPQGATLVVGTDRPGDAAGFEAARVDNVIRASLPPDRIRDFRILIADHADLISDGVPIDPPQTSDDAHDAIAGVALDEVRAHAGSGSAPVVVLASGQIDASPTRWFSPWTPVIVAPFFLIALALIGFGWSAWLHPGQQAIRLAAAPAFGLGAIVIAALVVDRVGLRLDGPGGIVAALAAAIPGFVLWIRQRRTTP